VTTILVPLVQATLSGSLGSVSIRTWGACVVALIGITIMGYDGDTAQLGTLSLPSLTSGDALILGAAVVYSLHVVRLGRWANETAPLKLVAYKATTELILGIVLMFFVVSIFYSGAVATGDSSLWSFFVESGREISDFFSAVQERLAAGTLPAATVQKAVAATLWTGIVSTAYTTYAQIYGQRRVKPADANLIYSLQPIFTALFAYTLLGETMGQWGFAGGALIGGAVYLAASQSLSTTKEQERDYS
jgi:drug/metabolite transporter (DMT)-like permease